MKICGVYQILNNISGRCYIGQSCNIEGRLKDHFRTLQKGCHDNSHLQRAFNKYGEQAFSTRILTRCAPEYLEQVENGWMERFKHDRYNVAPVAGSTIGLKWSDESKAAIKGRKLAAEHQAKITKTLYGNKRAKGYKMSESTKEKLLTSRLGCKASRETKAKQSAAMVGNKNPLGCKRTNETRIKMSAAQKLRWQTRRENVMAVTTGELKKMFTERK